MESLSSVSTIVRVAQDVAAAVATVSKNRTRCKKLAKRVRSIGDLLRQLDAVAAGTTTDAATQGLLDRLQETLSHALRLVRSCQHRSCPRSFISAGRMAEQFDEVDGEIDRCLLELSLANRLLIARLEKQLHLNLAAGTETETLTLRIGMPCDDNANNIKRCIRTIQGVVGVSAVASTKDKFVVSVRSGAVDIPSLLDQVQKQLNRNVEVVTPAATGTGGEKYDVKGHDKKAKHKRADVEDNRRHITGVELKKKKAAPTTMADVQQQVSGPYIYVPFKLVHIGDPSSTYLAPAPSPHGFVPYPSTPIHAPRQSNPRHIHFMDTSVNNYESAYCTKDTMKDADKDENKGTMPEHMSKGGGEWEEGEKITAVGSATAAIGVPLHTVTPGVPELVPPPSYGYGYWPYACGHSSGCCCHHSAAGPSYAAAVSNYNHYSQYPDMFSDENPNAYCSIM